MLLTVANVHEFGCTIEVTDKMRVYLHRIGIHLKKETTVINIPERSFIRAGFDSEKSNIQSTISTLAGKLIAGEIDIDTFYEFMGNYCVSRIQEYFINLDTPALHPATIAKKHSSNPLVDSGRLLHSITYKIL